jgi:hypothetical protein
MGWERPFGQAARSLGRAQDEDRAGDFAVDERGFQIGLKAITIQWGRQVVISPDELAPGSPRFPRPPWGQRYPHDDWL